MAHSAYPAGTSGSKIVGYLNLQVPAGDASPSWPIGPVLGQRGLNITEFCKSFNQRTKTLQKGTPIQVAMTLYQRPLL